MDAPRYFEKDLSEKTKGLRASDFHPLSSNLWSASPGTVTYRALRGSVIQKSEFNFLFEASDNAPELFEIERLGNDFVDCQFLLRPDVVGLERARKDNDSAAIVALSEFPHQFQPAGARHPVIGDYDIEFLLCDLGERVMAVFDHDDFAVGRVQSVGDGLADGWFVVDCENMEFLLHAQLAGLCSKFSAHGIGVLRFKDFGVFRVRICGRAR
jgi:hypothetical protein